MSNSTQASRTFGNLAEQVCKKKFVETELAQLLKAADPRIVDVTYGIKGDDDETVYVTMVNGYGYELSVGADGLMAIASDVTGFMKFK